MDIGKEDLKKKDLSLEEFKNLLKQLKEHSKDSRQVYRDQLKDVVRKYFTFGLDMFVLI